MMHSLFQRHLEGTLEQFPPARALVGGRAKGFWKEEVSQSSPYSPPWEEPCSLFNSLLHKGAFLALLRNTGSSDSQHWLPQACTSPSIWGGRARAGLRDSEVSRTSPHPHQKGAVRDAKNTRSK